MSDDINGTADRDDYVDREDRIEELTQAQQAGFSNEGGLDRKVEDAHVAHELGDDGDLTAPRDGASAADPTAPGKSGFDAKMGDGPDSQSGASAGSGGTGQRT